MTDKKTVLIVDDEADNRVIIETVVSEVGDFRILQAYGEEAYHLCLQEVPDLVITDVLMPGMDGFRLFRELMKHESMKNIPFIFVTGISEGMGSNITPESIAKQIGTRPAALEKAVRTALGL